MEAIDIDDLAQRIGREVEPAHDPVGEIHLHHDPDHVEIVYVALDPFPPTRFWPADGSRGRLVDPPVEDAFSLPVSVSDDGASVQLLPPELAAGQKALVPPEAMARDYREGRTSFADLLLWGEREVAAYDAWRRGEVYGVVRETLSLSLGSSGLTDVQASWDVLDLAGANRVLRETVDRREAELGPAAALLPAP